MSTINDIDALLSLNERGVLKTYPGSESIKETIKNLVFSFEDDFILRPDLGSITWNLLHEPLSIDTAFVLRIAIEDTLFKSTTFLNSNNTIVLIDIDELEEAYLVNIGYLYQGVEYSINESVEVL